MSFLKEKWFLIVNVLIFAGSVALYFTSVSGQSDIINRETNTIEKSTRSLRSMANRKPTSKWDSVLEKTQKELSKNRSYIFDKIGAADNLIHRYYDVANPELITKQAPELGSYLVYKSNFVKKWDLLREEYTQEAVVTRNSTNRGSSSRRFTPPPEFIEEFEDPSFFGVPPEFSGGGPSAIRQKVDSEEEGVEIKHFRCSPMILEQLEPSWLRNDAVPQNPLQLLNAMKQYWITVELLNIFEKVKIDTLLSIKISEPMRTDAYKIKENDFWGYREISLQVELKVGKTSDLIKAIHSSEYLFRAVGFDQRNILDLPEGVSSDAPHVTFDDLEERQLLRLNLWHFDYLQDGEVLAEQVGTSDTQTRSRSTSRRGRR